MFNKNEVLQCDKKSIISISLNFFIIMLFFIIFLYKIILYYQHEFIYAILNRKICYWKIIKLLSLS